MTQTVVLTMNESYLLDRLLETVLGVNDTKNPYERDRKAKELEVNLPERFEIQSIQQKLLSARNRKVI